MDGDVEVSEVGMATLVQEDVVGLEIAKGEDEGETTIKEGERTDA